MADWSDIVGLTLAQAKIRAAKYNHEVTEVKIGVAPVRAQCDQTKPTVMVLIENSGHGPVITAQLGVNQPSAISAPAT